MAARERRGFRSRPGPPLGLLYVCARFRAYRLRHEAFRSRSLNGLIEEAAVNGTPLPCAQPRLRSFFRAR